MACSHLKVPRYLERYEHSLRLKHIMFFANSKNARSTWNFCTISECAGLECRGRLVTALLYADDAVLFAGDEEGMRVSLEVLSGWCKQWSVEVNVENVGLCTCEVLCG